MKRITKDTGVSLLLFQTTQAPQTQHPDVYEYFDGFSEDLDRMAQDLRFLNLVFDHRELHRMAEDMKDRKKTIGANQIYLTSKGSDIIDVFSHDNIYVYVPGGRPFVPIQDMTTKELRKAHNIRRMYLAGRFDKEPVR